MKFTLIVASSSLICAWAHVMYPLVDYCSAAQTCRHDGRPVAAASCDGARRTFMDLCDMYEFNCDYGKHFEVIDKCVCVEENNCETEKTTISQTEKTSTLKPSKPHSEDRKCCDRPWLDWKPKCK